MYRSILQGAVLLAALNFSISPALAMPNGLRGNLGEGQQAARVTGPQHASNSQSLTVTPVVTAVGQSATLTAHFPALPNGTLVTFRDGLITLGTGTLSSGVASLNTSFGSAGSHAVSATVAAASAGQPAVQANLNQSVTLATATATLANSGGVTLGQATRLVATVTGASPTGSVNLLDGAAQVASATLANGSATLTWTFTSAGAHQLTARYAGDSRNAAATSAPLTVTVATAPSTTTLSSGTNPAAAGTSFTLTAKVSGTVAATGTVTFRDGSTVLGSASLANGAASLGTSLATPGNHSLTASYAGSASLAASTSAAISESVGPAKSATTLASSANPVAVGHALVLTARVSGNPGSGSVVFHDGNVTLGTVTPSAGVATLSTSFASLGTHALSASFGGTATIAASQSPSVAESVTASTTSTALSANPTAPSVGQSIKLTATISGGFNPSGSVTFRDGSTTLGSGTLTSSGSATLTATLATTGAHSLTASYGGDAANAVSTSSPLAVTVSAAATQTSLSASTTFPTAGQSVTLTARVSGSNATGTVTFRNGSNSVGSATLSGGAASLTTSFANAGSYSLSAAYGGNAANAASTSTAITVVVGSSSSSHPPATGNGIDYLGGPVMSSGANVYYIWYGNWSGSPVPNVLTKFINGLGGSAWWHINTTYSDRSGKAVNDSVTLMGTTSDNYSQGKTLTDNTVFSVVNSAITSGRLPVDPNGVYVVLTSADVNESSGFCTQYCGWHSSSTLNGTDIHFAFVGSADRCLSSCATGAAPNGSPAGDGMASVLAHELSESVSDPDLNAWYRQSTGDENGDLCAWNFGTTATTPNGQPFNVTLPTGQFMIQQMWLNAQGGRCALSYP